MINWTKSIFLKLPKELSPVRVWTNIRGCPGVSVWYWDRTNRTFWPPGLLGGVFVDWLCFPHMPWDSIRLSSLWILKAGWTHQTVFWTFLEAHCCPAGGEGAPVLQFLSVSGCPSIPTTCATWQMLTRRLTPHFKSLNLIVCMLVTD